MRTLLVAALLACACGGHTATTLDYTDAQTGTALSSTGDWRLVKSPVSTQRRLILELVGPMSPKARGVGFNLKAPDGVAFVTFADGNFAQDAGVFELKNSTPIVPDDPNEPVLFASGVKPGNLLTVGIFQKDRRLAAKQVNRTVLRIALELADGAFRSGDVIPLQITKARIVPDDIGIMGNGYEVWTKGHMQDVKVSLGTLRAL